MCDSCLLYYLAGVIDGEGTIRITKSLCRPNSPTYKYNIYLQICNTNLDLLEFISNSFGGYINLVRQETEKHKASYELCFTGRKAQEILLKIKDKCTIKKYQIELGLLLPMQEPGGGGRRVYSDEDLAFRDAIYEGMKKLNQKGPKELMQEPQIGK